ncbi:hypothetical protein HPB53_04040 [Lactiplantibacillus plantarum]|uniref:hypothetical protein n=1 Tax=Lactiplantibacillus plantarum TaxID=1590 RepID=UPI0014943970|nr:hypothetical protein [Lactiplantibacillus plantarum]QJY42142.1 hypothetical protein HPB53_04040 [Lactiplantibacillus plantarum]
MALRLPNDSLKVSLVNSDWNIQSWLTLIAVMLSVITLIWTMSSNWRSKRRIKEEINKHMTYLDAAICCLQKAIAPTVCNPWAETISELINAKSEYNTFALLSNSHGAAINVDVINNQIDSYLEIGVREDDNNPLVHFKEDNINGMINMLQELKKSFSVDSNPHCGD